MITNTKVFGAYVLSKHDLDTATANTADTSDTSDPSTSCTIPTSWTALKLIAVQRYNHDTSIFKFQLPEGVARLDLPLGAYLLVKAPGCEHGGGDAVRPYTSVSDDDVENCYDHCHCSIAVSTTATGSCCTCRDTISLERIGKIIVPSVTAGHNTSASTATGTFDLICKRYDQWGVKESIKTHFLFTKTDHSYRPAGAASNYIHRLNIGDSLQFKHNSTCRGRIKHRLIGSRRVLMIAVGVGIAPMIATIRAIIKSRTRSLIAGTASASNTATGTAMNATDNGTVTTATAIADSTATATAVVGAIDSDTATAGGGPTCCITAAGTAVEPTLASLSSTTALASTVSAASDDSCSGIEKIVLLYGVRTVADILLREVLESWQQQFPDLLKIVFCVGSRWANVHWGAKKKGSDESEYVAPPLPQGFSSLQHAELGWVNEEKILKYGFPPAADVRVLVCGLPAVYEKLCGYRDNEAIAPHSILHKLKYTDDMLIKL